MRIFRNGVENTSLQFDNDQLSALSLGMAGFDAQVGNGTMVVPGYPGWRAGDRITIYDSALIYVGFVGDYSISRNPRSPLELQTSFTLMDLNRQFLGVNVLDVHFENAPGPPPTADSYFTARYVPLVLLSDLTLDLSNFVSTDSVNIPAQTITGEGVTDILAQLILYTGWTMFLVPTATDAVYALHYHSLDTGVYSNLSINDDISAVVATFGLVTFGGQQVVFGGVNVIFGAAAGTIFPPRDPIATFSSTDLKNEVDVRNQTSELNGNSPASIGVHDLGGIHWAGVLSYGTDEYSLILFVNNLLNTSDNERPTYSCTLGPLTGAQVVELRAGNLINVTSTVWNLASHYLRIANVTLTISGSPPAPGYWDAHLELAYPFRQPTAAVGYGGTGGGSGALADPLLQIDHVAVTPGFVGEMPVGDSTPIVAQLEDLDNKAVGVPNITVTFTLVMWADEAETITGTGWSISSSSEVTDITGSCGILLTRDSVGTAIKVWVEANT